MTAQSTNTSEKITHTQAILLWATYIKRWGELVYQEATADMQRCQTLDPFDQAYLHAFWQNIGRKIRNLKATPLRTPAENKAQLDTMWRTIALEFNLPIDDSIMANDVRRRLDFFKKRIANEFELSIIETINQHEITSPIEQIFLIYWKYYQIEFTHGLQLQPQTSVSTHKGTYTVDFIVERSSGQSARVAIELDGHEFHERTKAQAANDKSRERAIVTTGLPVLRFTGSEVFNNPRHVMDEVISYFIKNLTQDK
jgi:very-short-patch-repair endonuclease